MASQTSIIFVEVGGGVGGGLGEDGEGGSSEVGFQSAKSSLPNLPPPNLNLPTPIPLPHIPAKHTSLRLLCCMSNGNI